MTVLVVTNQMFADVHMLLDGLETACHSRVYKDRDIIETAGQNHGIKTDLLVRVVQGAPIALNHFTHDREKALSALKKTLSDLISRGNCIFTGMICHLIPLFVTHVFRLLVVANRNDRIRAAVKMKGYTAQQAARAVVQADLDAEAWARQLKNYSPWDHSLYNMVIHLDRIPSIEVVIGRIITAVDTPPFSGDQPRETEIADLRITADAQTAMAHLGSGLLVVSDHGHVMVTLDKKQMNLNKTQTQIMDAVKAVAGVASVRTRIGPNYYSSGMIKNFDFGPSTGAPQWNTDKQKK